MRRRFLVGEAAKAFSPGARWVMYRGFASIADLDYAVDAMKARLSVLKPFKEEALRKRLFEDSPHSFSIQNYLTGEEKRVTLVVKDMRI